nr:hypothetical protein [Escherichia coli]
MKVSSSSYFSIMKPMKDRDIIYSFEKNDTVSCSGVCLVMKESQE